MADGGIWRRLTGLFRARTASEDSGDVEALREAAEAYAFVLTQNGDE